MINRRVRNASVKASELRAAAMALANTYATYGIQADDVVSEAMCIARIAEQQAKDLAHALARVQYRKLNRDGARQASFA